MKKNTTNEIKITISEKPSKASNQKTPQYSVYSQKASERCSSFLLEGFIADRQYKHYSSRKSRRHYVALNAEDALNFIRERRYQR